MVAEEQLQIPASWLGHLRTLENPSSATGILSSGRLEAEDKGGEVVVKNKSNDLHVKVCGSRCPAPVPPRFAGLMV